MEISGESGKEEEEKKDEVVNDDVKNGIIGGGETPLVLVAKNSGKGAAEKRKRQYTKRTSITVEVRKVRENVEGQGDKIVHSEKLCSLNSG